MKATINNSVSELNYLLSNASKLLTFDIDCSTMPEKEVFHDRSILRCNNYLGDMFSILDTITMNPAIYWFEATNRNNAQLFLQALTAYRNSTKRLEEYTNSKGVTKSVFRVLPAENSNLHTFVDSKILYVGKSEAGFTKAHQLSDISGRMIAHLGYYPPPTTQGLQLFYWARGIKEKLTLSVVRFPELIPDSRNQTKEYLSILEKLYAIQLRPLCGMH